MCSISHSNKIIQILQFFRNCLKRLFIKFNKLKLSYSFMYLLLDASSEENFIKHRPNIPLATHVQLFISLNLLMICWTVVCFCHARFFALCALKFIIIFRLTLMQFIINKPISICLRPNEAKEKKQTKVASQTRNPNACLINGYYTCISINSEIFFVSFPLNFASVSF